VSAFLRTPRFSPLDLCDTNRSVLAFNISYLFDRADLLQEAMDEVLGWVATGKLRMPPVTSFPFDKVADAHRAIESGTTVGKLALAL
jgi:NADPH:quinone reductase-like Zn-dependent oxidoreductase